jgi:uncharacterized YccA/Bax inhibitor family protein
MISLAFCLTALADGNAGPAMFMSMFFIAGLITALIIGFKRPQDPSTLIGMYALFEGLGIGGMSAIFEYTMPGVVIQAVLGTVVITSTMYFAYRLEFIRPTPTFNKVIGSLMVSIFFLYIISFFLSLLTPYSVPFLHSAGPIGIGLTAFILIVASLSLISDFGFIENGVKHGAPKNMEWYAAFGLLVSIVWVYIETLKLIWKLRMFFDD